MNEYSYCSNVILAGILHRSQIELGGSIIGQQDNLTAGLTNAEIKRVHDSELAHSVFQALSRGSCRAISNGFANPMKAWLIHADLGIKAILETVMTGVKWELWEQIDQENKGVTVRTAFDISAYLDGLSTEIDRVSTSKIRKELKLTQVTPTTWTKAINLAISQTLKWKLDGRSVTRQHQGDLLFPD